MKKTIIKYFDPWMGLAGAVAMGTFVFLINVGHGYIPGLTAASKQAAYTFLAGGILMRLTENLAGKYERPAMAYMAAIWIPTTLSVLMTYGVHSLRGTPEPLLSVIPTVLLSPPGFFWWAWHTRHRKQRSTA